MRKWMVVMAVLCLATLALAQTSPAQPQEIRMNQGGFCYLTDAPITVETPMGTMPVQLKIHAVTAGMAGKFGKMRADMWQTMNIGPDGAVTVTDGKFLFSMIDMAADPMHVPTIRGTYEGSGPALNWAGAAEVTTPLTVTGGTEVFENVKGTGIVQGSAIMQPPAPMDWFTLLTPTGFPMYDFFNIPAPAMQATPACAFRGDIELKLKYR